MKFLDSKHPFFKPLWRRWATCVLPLAWAGVELWTGNPAWAGLFAVAGAYAIWVLFLATD